MRPSALGTRFVVSRNVQPPLLPAHFGICRGQSGAKPNRRELANARIAFSAPQRKRPCVTVLFGGSTGYANPCRDEGVGGPSTGHRVEIDIPELHCPLDRSRLGDAATITRIQAS